MRRIVICDDDADIRAALRRTLRGYDVVETSTTAAALDGLRVPTAAILSDLSIDAQADGLELLQLVKLRCPETIRFVVTSNRILDVAVRALNEGCVDRYFSKPWNDDMLRAAIEVTIAGRLRSTTIGPVFGSAG